MEAFPHILTLVSSGSCLGARTASRTGTTSRCPLNSSSGAYNVPADPAARMVPWIRGPHNVEISKTCGLFRTGFRPSNRRQASGSLSWDLVVNSQKVMKKGCSFVIYVSVCTVLCVLSPVIPTWLSSELFVYHCYGQFGTDSTTIIPCSTSVQSERQEILDSLIITQPTNALLYIIYFKSLLKHFHCSYMFR